MGEDYIFFSVAFSFVLSVVGVVLGNALALAVFDGGVTLTEGVHTFISGVIGFTILGSIINIFSHSITLLFSR